VDQEVGAKGAFIVGLVATGQAADFSSAAKDYVRIRDMFEPHEGQHASYDELFEQFLAIRESTLPIWKRMADDRAR
jgi:xylulokinase